MRLGEALVKEGLINNDILARALERQIIFGGRLGTNLVEMGALSEEKLAMFLSKSLHVPYAEPSLFDNVPQEALDAFPSGLASKYTACPIKMERSRIHLAMKDPNDIAALDEIRFITGLDPKAYIASEIRIVFALEKYYGIKRDLRYISLIEDNNPEAAAGAVRPEPRPETLKVPQPPEPVEFLGDESQENIYSIPAEDLDSHFAPVPAHEFQSQPAPQAQAAPVVAPQALPAAAPVAPKPVTPAAASSPYEALASPADREHIADALLAGALLYLHRAALFLVKGNVVTGWKAGGSGLDTGMVTAVTVGLDDQSIFKYVVEEKANYKGPVLRVPQNVRLLDALGGVYPQEAIAYPLVIKGKVVCVLYGDNGEGAMIKNVEELIGLMAKGSMSLEILILKNKILG